MERIQTELLSSTYLITLPKEFRNNTWGTYFGGIQQTLRNTPALKEVIINASNCTWIDPMPILSIIIALYELPKNIEKKFYLKSREETSPDHQKVMAFLEKEGFLICLQESGTQLIVPSKNGDVPYTDSDRQDYLGYQASLKYENSTILPATVKDLEQIIKHHSLESWISKLLHDLRHRLKLSGPIENQIFNKLNLLLKETVENIREHAYAEGRHKFAGIYIRFRRGLADNSLESSARNDLKSAIEREHQSCPTLKRSAVENINSFIEVFVLDAGIGLSSSYFKHSKAPKHPFREAWRQTIGLGQRGQYSNIKNTKFGGLYTIGRVLEDNFLSARDADEWIGDELPIVATREEFDANRSYMITEAETDVTGLGLIARISWKVAADENTYWFTVNNHLNRADHPIAAALEEETDIYIKYWNQRFSRFKTNPIYIRDDKHPNDDLTLQRKYFKKTAGTNFCLYLPAEELVKNEIHRVVSQEFNHLENLSRTLIIGDIPVWETGLYQLALIDAKYPTEFLLKYDKIILVSKRLTICILTQSKQTFVHSPQEQINFINWSGPGFHPNLSLKNYVEWLRTHDSLLFWRYLELNNPLNEFFLRSEIDWYQGETTLELQGYLNFSKTLTDTYCVRIYENSLERTLAFSNDNGCHYESIDLLTTRLCQYINHLFYNKTAEGASKIFLGSVFVSGYSQKASQVMQPESAVNNIKLHFFYNTNVAIDRQNLRVMHLFLWPVSGKEWFGDALNKNSIVENKGKYRRIGATHVIAPSGWKYFPIPRYKLFNKEKRSFIDNFTAKDVLSPENDFISIYKCPPPETYSYWQGKKNHVLSYGHISYENNHELFKIDFPFIIDESFILGDELAQFLLGEFAIALNCQKELIIHDNDALKNGVNQYILNEKEYYSKHGILDCAVVVYPYHFNTDHAISKLKDYLPKRHHDKIIALFPVTNERSSSAFIPSPLTIETIGLKIEEFSKRRPDEPINVMLFDDSTISGKTRVDINHILYSLGVKNVKTVSIVERTRLPFSTSYPYKHKAFWRLDIPKFGSTDTCPVCMVIQDINEFGKMLVSDNARLRLDEWIDTWKKSSPFESRDSKPITPVLLDLPENKRFKKFGIYFNGIKHEQCGGDANKIEIVNSLGLSIYIAELHSMTSRDDIVLEYFKDPHIPDAAKLEMACTNLLLFGPEFSRVIQQDIIKAIFILANGMPESNLTSYAAITLLAQPKQHLEILYDIVKDTNESDVRVKNYDMKLVLSRISTNVTSKFAKSQLLTRLHKSFGNLSTLYKQFHAELYNDFGRAHDTPLHQIINGEFDNMKTIKGVRDSCDKLIFLLNSLHSWYFRTDNNHPDYNFDDEKQKVRADFRIAKSLILQIKSVNDPKIEEFKAVIKNALIGAERFHSRLFLCVKGPARSDYRQTILMLIQEKGIPDVGVSESFKILNDAGSQYNRWLCWDRDTRRMVHYVINNSRHAKDEFYDPFDFSEEEKKAWISVEINDVSCTLLILNKSEKTAAAITEETNLKEKPEKRHVKELKIEIKYADVEINEQKYIETRIILPFINTY